jgi:radical SAM protein with 4Fe4S-binding SPASM domain
MGVEEVAFSGGEPLIWRPINDLIHHTSKSGIRVVLYTSGNVPRIGEAMHAVKAGGAQRCVFSIFGATEHTHERVTRIRGSFDKTVHAIAAARQAGLAAEIHFVPLAQTYNELEGIASLAERHKVGRISVLRFVPQGRGVLIKRHCLNRLQNLSLKRTIERLRQAGFDIRTGSPYNFLMLNDQPKCCSAIDRLIIGPDLHVYPCDAFKQVEAEELVGTKGFSCLSQHSLRDCWEKSPYLLAVRKYLTTPFPERCEACAALGKCLSGCLAQKVIAYGSLDKRGDPMCLRSDEVE